MRRRAFSLPSRSHCMHTEAVRLHRASIHGFFHRPVYLGSPIGHARAGRWLQGPHWVNNRSEGNALQTVQALTNHHLEAPI